MKLHRSPRGLAPLIIILAIFLILAAGVLIINFSNVPKDRTTIPVPLPNPMNIQSPGTVPALPLSSYISYVVPKGWKEGSVDQEISDYYAAINSPDYKVGGIGNADEGAQISITRNNETQSLEELKMNPSPGMKDFTYTEVAGLEALRFHSDYEGHGLVYVILKDGYSWSIVLVTPDLKTENKYLGLFSAFLQSVKFK